MLFQKLLCPIRLRLTEPRVTFSLNFFPSRCALQRKSINVNKSKRLQDLNLTFMTEKLSRIMGSLFFRLVLSLLLLLKTNLLWKKLANLVPDKENLQILIFSIAKCTKSNCSLLRLFFNSMKKLC